MGCLSPLLCLRVQFSGFPHVFDIREESLSGGKKKNMMEEGSRKDSAATQVPRLGLVLALLLISSEQSMRSPWR